MFMLFFVGGMQNGKVEITGSCSQKKKNTVSTWKHSILNSTYGTQYLHTPYITWSKICVLSESNCNIYFLKKQHNTRHIALVK